MKKKNIKKVSEEELEFLAGIAKFRPFDKHGVLVDKGDVKAPDWDFMLDWEDIFPDWEGDMEDESIPTKDMTRNIRRKRTFNKRNKRVDMYLNKGYTIGNLSIARQAKTKEGVGDAPKVLHQDKMYFRGTKAQKKLGKAMTTNEAKNLMAQIAWEAEQDREMERREAERLFALDELASMKDDFNRLSFMEVGMKQSISDLIHAIHEANAKLDDLYPRLNSLQMAKESLKKEIAKLEEVVNG